MTFDVTYALTYNVSMFPIHKTFSIRDLQRRYREVIETAKQSQDAVVLINKSVPEAVLLDKQTYDELVRDEYIYDEPYLLKLIKQAKSSYISGKAKKLQSWDELDA
ncbi:MAG: hypothetical protein ABII13_01005 [Patescibacteria group bacterium]|nr:type II toxin-antitoxin system Phd/YefM family antitoxin [Patescibacteria group bacterium]MBU2508758.1 type II toxin-antitoxin system Phd/YefM family antitoxin [Patescibacteria group bacterium]